VLKGKTARAVFAGVCFALAFLLLFTGFNVMAAVLIFAGALVIVGLLSRGFRRT
jgi:hypothetical protein